jgi:hypothetical protein
MGSYDIADIWRKSVFHLGIHIDARDNKRAPIQREPDSHASQTEKLIKHLSCFIVTLSRLSRSVQVSGTSKGARPTRWREIG